MSLLSGVDEGVPYSLSRYTDVPNSKWAWFQSCLESKKMVAFDPRKASAPGVWSLQPEDTLGLVFWTKNPMNLLLSQEHWRHQAILRASKRDDAELLRLEQLMDSLQESIATHPADPRWVAFRPTLDRVEPLLQRWKRKFGL